MALRHAQPVSPPWAGLILAAGFGTRMGTRPKAFLQVGGTTVLDLACTSLAEANIGHAVVVHNARWAASFDRWRRESAEAWRDAGLHIDTLNDGALDPDGRRGAVGDLAIGLAALGRSEALMIPVDTVFTWPLAAFLERAGAVDPCLGLRSIRRGYEDLGRADIDGSGVLRNFYEGRRPDGSHPWAPAVWLGPAALTADVADHVAAYCAEVHAAREIPDRLGLFMAWLLRRRTVRGVVMDDGEAWDVGTPGGLSAAQGTLGA